MSPEQLHIEILRSIEIFRDRTPSKCKPTSRIASLRDEDDRGAEQLAKLTVIREIEATLEGHHTESERLPPAVIQIIHIRELSVETEAAIRTGGQLQKNQGIDALRKLLLQMYSVPAKDETEWGNLLVWSGSYFAFRYPKVMTTLAVCVSAGNMMRIFLAGDGCGVWYQSARWLLLLVGMTYLLALCWKSSLLRFSP